MYLAEELIRKRIVIIGSNGLLGQHLVNFYKNNPRIELLAASASDNSCIDGVPYKKLDITNKNKVREVLLNFFPDVVINAAAYTDVDACETDREISWKINVGGTENLALYSWTVDALMIHISSDYIFDGKSGPYSEDDKPCPINYYGRTKLAAENTVRASGVRYCIVRTNVLYGSAKNNKTDFVKWVIKSLKSKKQINVVTDQINNPTFVDDAVNGINKLIEFKKEGIYNIAGGELLSRFDFAKKIAQFFDLDESLIKPIDSKQLKQAAPRPLKSGLITLKAQSEIAYRPTSLLNTLKRIKKDMNNVM
ncbi:dTDP-4-dehydrorhamnose reductase [Melioribacteraceae bacterium 4301-Me]|uniref:dTDP-4-dehydrorhamnose reductase n=1 Tax=Pyranulibacter aquaticus TaxID=3163344 RepID=UPI00359B67FB